MSRPSLISEILSFPKIPSAQSRIVVGATWIEPKLSQEQASAQ